MKEFQKFRKTFNLSAYANDIGFVLDEEPEVSRFYAELVPAELTPEIFWARSGFLFSHGGCLLTVLFLPCLSDCSFA